MQYVPKRLDELQSLSDLEIHQLQKKYGLPNIPVTETTRNILINRLHNRIKSENFKQKNAVRETEEKFVPSMALKRKPTATYLQRNSIEYVNCIDTKPQQQGIPMNRYALSPILTTNDNERENGRKQMFLNASAEKSNAYGNNFQFGAVGRLLSLRDSTLAKSSVLPKAASSSMNDFHRVPHRTNKFTRKSLSNFLKQFVARFALRNEIQWFISQALVWAFFAFFIVIALVYTLSHPDQLNAIQEMNTRSTVCDFKTNKSQLSKDCIEEQHLSSALDLNKSLFLLLQDRAKHHHCVNNSKSPALSLSAFMEKRHNHLSGDNRPAVNIMHDIKYLILNNPQWQIGLMDVNGKTIEINSKSDLSENDIFFYLLKPNLPIMCVLYKKLNQFFMIVGIAAIVSCCTLLCYSIFSYLRHRAEISGDEKNRLISEIINELSANFYENDIIVNHLRDKLIPINERKRLLDAWNEALKVLERNDSRIQFALKLKNGEKVRTMKWIGNVPGKANQNLMLNVKQWQSPAFDNTHQTIRPPTSCLKIRHMFDTTEICNPNLDQLIYNAIIEKVGPKCRILDIKLDKQTCCVYVRCATEEDAGIVHNEINGWWFDKRLLSIKFLRLERFITRFPKSDA